MLLLYLLILFAYEVTYASEFVSSDSFPSHSCNKYEFFFLPEADFSILVPVKLACM